jgi:hypothetical protein
MPSRHELSAIISATAIAGGPLFILGEVLERRVRAGAGLSPAEVRAAQHLIAAARAIAAQDQPAANPALDSPADTSGAAAGCVVPLLRDSAARPDVRPDVRRV